VPRERGLTTPPPIGLEAPASERAAVSRFEFAVGTPAFFRSFVGRIRGFRLPIHLQARAAALRLLARDPLRHGFLRRGWHGYGLGPQCAFAVSGADVPGLQLATSRVWWRA
jgi:hypothetical protein